MAAKKNDSNKSKKRKPHPGARDAHSEGSASKKPKLVVSSNSEEKNTKSNKPLKPFMKKKQFEKTQFGKQENKGPLTKRERRLHAKELAEVRKKRRKRYYNLEQELGSLWEKMRQRNIAKEERSKLITEALQKMKGKIPEIASSHVSSRVLQTCVKYCSQPEKDAVYDELKPHFLAFACNTYAVFLVKKMLDNASKKQLAEFISSLRGHVASLLRHMVGSSVVEHAYQLGNASQKQELLMELYATELQLFKDLASIKESRLQDIISKLNLQKSVVIRHMTLVIQPILEKGIVDHSIIHRMLIEYFSIADKSPVEDVLQQLSGPLLVRMIHTKDGSKIGILCVKYGSAKERKKIIKGMKDHIGKMAHDQYGSLVLAYIVSTVDDTKLINKIVIRELQTNLKELALDKNGRRPVLQLLHPNCSRYFSPDDLASFSFSIPSLSSKVEVDTETMEVDPETKSSKEDESSDDEGDISKEDPEKIHFIGDGKKDPSIRRQEILVGSGFAENLVNLCIEKAGELLRSKFGKEVLYEVATGGSGGILHQTLDDKLNILHDAIASLVAKPKSNESENEHVLENFHSSRTIRKLILDCPNFATTLWMNALKGNCESWSQGHSSKVIYAFLESPDANVREMVAKELQPLVDGGVLKVPGNKQPAKEG